MVASWSCTLVVCFWWLSAGVLELPPSILLGIISRIDEALSWDAYSLFQGHQQDPAVYSLPCSYEKSGWFWCKDLGVRVIYTFMSCSNFSHLPSCFWKAWQPFSVGVDSKYFEPYFMAMSLCWCCPCSRKTDGDKTGKKSVCIPTRFCLQGNMIISMAGATDLSWWEMAKEHKEGT